MNAIARIQRELGNPLAQTGFLSVFFDLIGKGSSLAMGLYLADEFTRPLIVQLRRFRRKTDDSTTVRKLVRRPSEAIETPDASATSDVSPA